MQGNASFAIFSNQMISLIESIALTGLYQGRAAKVFNILGRRAGFTSTSVLNDVVQFANSVADIPVLTGAESLEVVSSSANDTVAGTGAQKVKVTYINNSYALVESAEISLNGTTPVAAGFTAMAILWMEVTAVGSGIVSAGNIRLRVVTGPVECEQISAGGNKSLSGRFMVPDGYKAYIPYWDGRAINNDQDLRLRATVNTLDRTLSSVYHFVDSMYLANNAGETMQLPWFQFPARCRVKVSTISAGTAGTVRTDISITLVLIHD